MFQRKATPARPLSLLTRVLPAMAEGDVAVVAHGHLLRVLAAVYLDLPPVTGAALLLDAGSISILESEKGVPSIRTWNWRPDLAH